MEEIQEDDIRADIEEKPKKRVADYSSSELNELRDISRLPRQLKAKLAHREELLPPIDKNAATIEKQRMLYARLGQKSGLPPGIMWPSKSQLKFTVEDDKTYFATLQEMIQVVKNEEAEKIENNRIKQEEITRKMKEMPSLIDEFKNKLKVREEAEKEAMRQQADLLDEARDYFGYAIEENDDRIVKFLEQKENAEKEKVKAEKKAARQAEAKKQLEELARRATEEALKMAALDASGKDKDVTTLTTDDLATMTFSQNNDTNSAGSGGDGQKWIKDWHFVSLIFMGVREGTYVYVPDVGLILL